MQKSILITGCSSGIGYYCAKALADEGYHVLATARKKEDVERLKSEGLTSFQLDLCDTQSIHRAVEWALQETNHNLYALFNNGAYGQPGAVEDIPTDALRAQFEANFFGWHELTCLLIPHLMGHESARIIQNSSVLGFVAMPFRGAYNASKFAIEGLTDTLRLELKDTGVKVCLIEPGPILSKFRKNALIALKENIDIGNSRHEEGYRQAIARLEKEGPSMAFTLGPEAVLSKLKHALESEHPKARYYVTVPTYLMGYLKRILPTKMMDHILGRSK
ncbi:SDR family oxidoreductase [Algicola sagamiensis]|uniref:SDR family oxidoreductase n=1 Tax=Algicola sagamiensis TaxID=163869 RepID=UPI000369A9F5|nr:SDR family oxidoreductase [Algicola sagamiensis]